MTAAGKKSAGLFRRQYGLLQVTEEDLCDALEKQGYTVVYFNRPCRDADVLQVVTALHLEPYISASNGFTYTNEKYRLVFVNEALSREERLTVLAHEEGHIFCGHVSCRAIAGQDVLQEHEANEFAHFLLHPTKGGLLAQWAQNHKKAVAIGCACLLLLAAGGAALALSARSNTYYGNYYVTASGEKYHKKNCVYVANKTNIRRLTKEEFSAGKYEPCKVCLPE